MMFISHYDESFITCTYNQFDELLYDTQALFKFYGRAVTDYHLLTALFESDDIYYSAKYLFKSKKSEKELYPKYCNLAKLVFIYLSDNIYNIELNAVVSNLSVSKISLDEIQEISL